MLYFDVNYLSVLAGGVVSIILGSLWYSPLLFGKIWMRCMGIKPEDCKPNPKGMWKSYSLTFLGSLVMAYVLNALIWATGAGTLSAALFLALVLWVGLLATTGMSEYLFTPEKKPWTLYLINTGYQLTQMLLIAAVAVWLI